MNLRRVIAFLGAVLATLVCLLTISLCAGTTASARFSATPTATAAPANTPTQTTAPTRTLTPTPTASPVPTSTPTAPPTATSTSTRTPAPALTPAPDRKTLAPMNWVGQTWNNCAPASLSMVLSYYGIRETQETIAKAMHPEPLGKHVGPLEITEYLAGKGLLARPLINGSVDVLQRLAANGIPVLVTTWIRSGEDVGHYRVLKGYDRGAGVLTFNDAYWGQDYRLSTAVFDALWWPFNRLYLPVFRPQQEPAVRAIVGEDWDQGAMLRKARAAADQATLARPTEGYAWYNLGDVALAQDDIGAAVKAFDKALSLDLPPRMLWYRVEALAAYNKAAQHQKVLDLTAPLLAKDGGLAQVHEQRGFAYLGLGRKSEATAEFRLAIRFDPALSASREALKGLGQ